VVGVVTDPTTGPGIDRKNLLSTCVVDLERLRLDAVSFGSEDFPGVCSEFRVSQEYLEYDPAHCTKLSSQHIGARQIFPLLMCQGYTTPTVKHHCPATSLASCIRACSNKVFPNAEIFNDYSIWFKSSFAPKFLRKYEKSERKVNFYEWLKRYPVAYRNNLVKAVDLDHIRWDIKTARFKAFPKIEMQFTDVISEDKNSPNNKVKERQICGPIDAKKVFANPFINVLEGVANTYKAYCGSKNWPQMCEEIDRVLNKNPDFVFTDADGSGFDMTQLRAQHELVDELILSCAKSGVTTFETPQFVDLASIQMALEASHKLRVQMDDRNILYTVRGRASGDGWTTFGNTMLMISYFEYLAHRANVKQFFLKVKGDDVLFGVPRAMAGVVSATSDMLFARDKAPQFKGLGQILDKFEWKDITQTSFLSNHFFRDSTEKLRMVRIPTRVLQTLSWSTKIPAQIAGSKLEEACANLTYSKGSCLAAWAGDLPIWGVLAKKMMQLGRPGKYSEYDPYADEARVWFKQTQRDRLPYMVYLEETYGVGPAVVNVIEQRIWNITSLYGLVAIPELAMFL
jgi:hypothetical protein